MPYFNFFCKEGAGIKERCEPLFKMIFSPKLIVMLKILSSEYQVYDCGKIFRMPRFWDENLHFAQGSCYKKFLRKKMSTRLFQ